MATATKALTLDELVARAKALGPSLRSHALRAVLLDWLPQTQFDRLLWSADLSIVRGEDSLVRALWAGAPFVWQLYPQHDGAHRHKLQAFLERWRVDGTVAPPPAVAQWFAWWNADAAGAVPPSAPLARWRESVCGWREQLVQQSDLTTQLLGFAAAKR